MRTSLLLLFIFVLASAGRAQTYEVTLTFTPDCWGNETAWSLEDSNDSVIASVALGTYTLSTPNGTGTYTYVYDLAANECYEFTITDDWGDGMTGSQWSNCNMDGDFQFTSGTTVISELNDPDFGSEVSYSFCIAPGCTNVNATNYNASANVDDGSCLYAPPVASFTFSTTDPSCGSAIVSFTNESTAAISYSWTFNQGTPATSTLENPSVTFPSGGTFKAILIVSNDNGSDSSTHDITLALDEGGNEITFVIDPDCYASDIAWTLEDSNGNLIYSVDESTYTDNFPDNDVELRTTFCLTDDCYDLTITDSYGDGFYGSQWWACDDDGDYWFEDADGNEIHNFSGDVDFGDSYDDNICINLQYIWTGAFDSDWDNTGNWTGGSTPESTDNVVITTTGSNPSLDAMKTVNDIRINAGSAIEFANSSGKLRLKGDLVNLGTFDASAGMVIMLGNKLQYVKGVVPTFYKFKINTNDSVRLLTDINLRGSLMPKKGVLDFNDQSITLLSAEDYTGSIGRIYDNAEIIGDEITLQRYFPSGPGSWRMLCTPIIDATFESWNDDLVTTGFEGADYPNYPSADNPWSNIRYYDETYWSGDGDDLDSGFVSIGNITDIIGNTLGYFVYLVPGPTTVDVTGDFLKGDKTFNLDFTESNSINMNDGWNLVANPYPSAIDWDASAGWTTSDLNNSIYAYDPINGQYSSYVNGISVGSLTNEIASTQAFWVKSESGSPSMDIGEKAKINTTGVHMKSEDINTVATIRLRLTAGEQWDETVIGFNLNASNDFDPAYDAYKFYASNTDLPNLASVADSVSELSINLIPIQEDEVEIPLIVKKGEFEELALSNELVDTDDENICMVLEDKELGVSMSFEEGDVYSFVMGAESLESRFSLYITTPLQSLVSHETCAGINDGSIALEGFGSPPWHYIWKNGDGEIIQETEGSYTSDSMTDLAPDFYELIVMNSSANCNIAAQMVEVEPAMDEAMAAAVQSKSCLAQLDGEIEVNLDQEYSWDIILINDDSEESIEIEAQFNDTLFTGLGPGSYTLIATSHCGNDVSVGNLDVAHPQSVEAEFYLENIMVNLNNNESAVFLNMSSNANSFAWDFGDGTIDSLVVDPVHFYEEAGDYLVTLTSWNIHCSHSTQQGVMVVAQDPTDEQPEDAHSLHEMDWGDVIITSFKPNAVVVYSTKAINAEIILSIFNATGQLVVEQHADRLTGTPIEVKTAQLAQGVFYFHINSRETVLYSEKFMKN